MTAATLIARKEAGELLLSVRGLVWLTAVAVALSAFGLLLVSNTELSLLDNAQVVYDMCAIVTALASLIALIAGIDAVAGERERGSLLPLMLTPAPRSAILGGKLGGTALAWGVIYALSLPYLWAVGSTGQNMADSMAITALLGTPIVLGFGFFGMGLGGMLDSPRTALLAGLVTLGLSASPLLIGASFRQSAIGQLFDAVNPLSAAANGYDAVIIDSQGIVAQGVHGLVAGVWLALTVCLAALAFRRTAT
jgi:ABC-type transport system involved in multi-copper enzyme maturation permease subunit